MKAFLRKHWGQIVAAAVLVALGLIVLRVGGDETAAKELVARLGGQYTFDSLDRITEISLAGRPVTNQDLAVLANLAHLRTLDLSQTAVTDRGLAILRDGHAPLTSIVVATGNVSQQAAGWFDEGTVNFGTPQHPPGG